MQKLRAGGELKRRATIKSYEERAFDMIYETRFLVISKLWTE